MSFLNKLISSLSFLCLFGCSSSNDEQDRQDLLKWISHQLIEISMEIEEDINKEKRGFYPHHGKENYQSKGYIDIELKEKSGDRLDVSSHSLLTITDIQNSEGYKQLRAKTHELSATLNIREVIIDGDEVETMEELDEYIDDVHHYYVITLRGWQADLEV